MARTMGSVVILPITLPWQPKAVMITDYRLACQILENPRSLKWHTAYKFIDRVSGGTNMFSAEGIRYKHARKATAPAFSSQNVARMKEIVQTVVKEWTSKVLEPKIQRDESIDISEEMQHVTIDVIGRVAFDYIFTKQEREIILSSLKIAYLEFAIDTPKNPFRRGLLGALFPGVRWARQASRDIQDICHTMLQHYRSQENAPTNTIVAMIDKNNEYSSDHERVCDMITYLAGGYDTASYTS